MGLFLTPRLFLVFLALASLASLVSSLGTRAPKPKVDPYPYNAPDDTYPLEALNCYSSLTSPDNQLICPEGRSGFCVKEVVSLKEDLCGKTQYFGDVYNEGVCEFKTCARNCTEEMYEFIYGPYTYTRTRYCCTENWCNSAPSNSKPLTFAVILFISFLTAYLGMR